MGGPTKNNVSTSYLGERFVRHPLTNRNLEELEVSDRAHIILERDKDKLKRKAEKKNPNGTDRYVYPTGFSLNRGRFGDFPEAQDSAHQRGWRAYMTMGVPLVEERGDITQPPPDVISKQTFTNRTDPTPTTWAHTVEFSISNTINWSLEGQVQLTFGAKSSASLQQQLQKSMEASNYQKTTLKNSKDNQGVDMESQSQSTSTATATGTATGTGEVSAQLMLGIAGSVSGSLSTSYKTSSTLSGEVGSRVDVLATQRRQVRRFDYEYPVSFGGWVALYYPEPVEVKEVRPVGPQPQEPKYSTVLAWKLGETGTEAEAFDLTDEGKPFMQKGEAEVVSTLAGVHEVFELEELHFDKKQHPLHKVGLHERESSRKAPVELATGLGWADGLALDLPSHKAYVTDRRGDGKLYRVDLGDGGTEVVAEGLRAVNDVALDLPSNKAYVADYSGKRLFTIDLSENSPSPVPIIEDIALHGVALDLPNNKAYVTDANSGKLIELDLDGEPARRQRTWQIPRAAGIALGGGKAYVGQWDRRELYEVDLEGEDDAPQLLATNLGYSIRVALDGAGNAYVSDPTTGRLREIIIADGEAKGRQHVVADGLGQVTALGLDHGSGHIYVCNRQGQLLRISDVLPDGSAES